MNIAQFIQNSIARSSVKREILKILPNRRRQWNIYYEKKKLQYLPLEEIKKYQLDKFKQLLIEAIKSPYYKEIIKSFGKSLDKFTLEDLKKFPVLTKDIIRKEKTRLLTKPIEELFSNSSGGSTGEPINFYQDQNYRDHVWATMMIIMETCGWFYGARVARLWGAPQDKPGLKGKIAYFLQNTRFYDSFNMSEENMLKYYKDMEKFQPDVIISYASSIYLLAKFLEKKGIKPNYPKISISTSAETLHPYMRETIERVFNVKVFDKYGSREVSAIAYECEANSGSHIIMDNVIVECIDPITGEEVWDRPGELLITDLNNYGMPFIRYKIGDMGILSKEKCRCGRNTLLLKRVIGRTTDNFILKNGRIVHGEYFTHLFYGLEGIKEFQFVQEKINKFTLYIVKDENFNVNVINKLEQEIKNVVGNDSQLNLLFVETIPKTPTGKYRFTISKINLDEVLNTL
jgi:phenylacetate-CoA ligase